MGDDERMILGELRAQVASMNDLVREHREEGRDRGKRIFGDLETIRMEASHTKRSVEDLKAWKDSITPELATLQKWRERGIGAWMVIVFLSGFVGAIFVTAWKWIAVKLGIST